jgi:hypothetical protein
VKRALVRVWVWKQAGRVGGREEERVGPLALVRGNGRERRGGGLERGAEPVQGAEPQAQGASGEGAFAGMVLRVPDARERGAWRGWAGVLPARESGRARAWGSAQEPVECPLRGFLERAVFFLHR